MFEAPSPSLFITRYREASEMEPERQAALIQAVKAASRIQPVGIVFVVGSAIRRVDFSVPSFWIKALADPGVRIAAMAIVTESKAVEIAAGAFGAANKFRRLQVEVRTFADERTATGWARQVVLLPVQPSA